MNPILAELGRRAVRFSLLLLLLFSACEFSLPGAGDHALGPAAATRADVTGVLLTWQDDPTTTMTIDWHTVAQPVRPVLQYRRVGNRPWRTIDAQTRPFPFSDRHINRAHLENLQPGTTYEFRFDGSEGSFRFRTMPAELSREIRFAAGGDTMHQREWFSETNRQVARHDVDFILFAGDLAYADGRPDLVERWYQWMESVTTTLVRPDRRLIPILVTIGNHEVRHGYADRAVGLYLSDEELRNAAPYFMTLFAAPGMPGYSVLDFGDYLSLFLLDSHHLNTIDGRQLEWLRGMMAQRRHVMHVIPAYHVPAFPSVRSMDSFHSAMVRKLWTPVFEQGPVRLAIEAHDHAYKRTKLIRNNREDPTGIMYVGDGAWGVTPRGTGSHKSPEEDVWYLDRAEAVKHFVLVTLKQNGYEVSAYDQSGSRFDHAEVAW